MAIYEYQCDDCHETFTVSQAISEHGAKAKRRACPKCKSRATHQLFSSFFAKTSSKS
jgi:putative FmdB family regulatory protein